MFLRQAIRHPRQVGTLVPSSPFLRRRVVNVARVHAARVVVELGAGTGALTRQILQTLPKNGALLSIEINPHFCQHLSGLDDSRLTVHCGSACNLREVVSMYDLPAPDVVISGLPFSAISLAEGSQIIDAISSLLAPGGRFVAYQLSRRVNRLLRHLPGAAQVEVELLNIPPLRVYTWQKP